MAQARRHMSASALDRLLTRIGPEVEDPDEETFLLFAHERPPAQNLGFVDRQAAVLELTVAGRDLTIHQSPGVLTSNRAGGTTGAVLWKVSPMMAEWLASPDNVFFRADDHDGAALLGPDSAVLELGCGIGGIIGLTLTGKGRGGGGSSGVRSSSVKKRSQSGTKRSSNPTTTHPSSHHGATGVANTVGQYVLTDQAYVSRFLLRNLEENGAGGKPVATPGRSRKPANTAAAVSSPSSSVYFRELDWETDEVTPALLRRAGDEHQGAADLRTSFDAIVACDCIYNEALVAPLVQTCVDACRLRQSETSSRGDDDRRDDSSGSAPPPTVCIVALQLRDPDVQAAWLGAFHAAFRVWRIGQDLLTPGLWPTAGFSVLVGILREN